MSPERDAASVLHLPDDLPSGRVERAIANAVQRFELVIGREGELRGYPGSRHWHLRRSSGRGVLELTWWPQMGRLWPKVNAGRAAPWIDETLAPLMDDIAQQLDEAEREDVATVLNEAGLPAGDMRRLLAKRNKRIYRVGDLIVQLWYGHTGGGLARSGAALDALAGAVAVPTLLHQELARPESPHQAQITTRLPGVTLEEAWPDLDQTMRHSLIRQLGALMEAMHSVASERLKHMAALDGPRPWADRCRDELAARLSRARRSRKVDAAALKRITAYVERHAPSLDLSPSCLVHTDIHFGNLLVENGTLTGLIDFENAEVGGRDRDAYMLIGDSVGWMMQGGSDDVAENGTLQAVRWLQEAYPALYATPNFAARQFLYLMLEPEDWNGTSIDRMAGGWIRAFDGGWIERWFGE